MSSSLEIFTVFSYAEMFLIGAPFLGQIFWTRMAVSLTMWIIWEIIRVAKRKP